MQQHTIHFWTHLVVLCSLEQEGGMVVLRGQIIKLGHQSLTFSGFMVLSRQLGTQKKTRLNHDDVIDLQVVALEKGQSSQLTVPFKMYFPVGARFFRNSQLS